MRHDELVDLAEQSTLGALMLRPDALTSVRAWLRPGDFADLWHAQVYTALLERQPVGGLDPNSMAAVLVDRLGTRMADLPRFARLLGVTPLQPDPLAYGRMVAEGALRREIAGLGILLQAAALDAASDRTATPLLTTCSMVDAGLDVAGGRWASANGEPHDDVVVPLHLRAAVRNTGLEARTAADKHLSANPPRDLEAERAHIVTLVGTLIAHPEIVPAVADWLPAARIQDPVWRLIYGTTIELAELGRHVDVATVAWAAYAHTPHGPDLPSVGTLQQAVEQGRYAYPPDVLRTVAADQVRHLADVGAEHLRTAATNPAVLVCDLVDTGHTITTALRTAATALPSQPLAHPTTSRAMARTAIGGQVVTR